jgi:hypothetical protein
VKISELAERDVRRVANIQYLLGLGFGTADALLFAECLDAELARHRLAELDHRMAALSAVRERLATVLADGERQLAEAG